MLLHTQSQFATSLCRQGLIYGSDVQNYAEQTFALSEEVQRASLQQHEMQQNPLKEP